METGKTGPEVAEQQLSPAELEYAKNLSGRETEDKTGRLVFGGTIGERIQAAIGGTIIQPPIQGVEPDPLYSGMKGKSPEQIAKEMAQKGLSGIVIPALELSDLPTNEKARILADSYEAQLPGMREEIAAGVSYSEVTREEIAEFEGKIARLRS